MQFYINIPMLDAGFLNLRAMEAKYWENADGKIRCHLCPHQCLIAVGKRGICQVRHNDGGHLVAESYGKITALHLDPVEKKPLYHFFPGTSILSLGSMGCNMHCKCCQNWQISQSTVDDFKSVKNFTPVDIVKAALAEKGNIGLAFTYNEPSIGFEFMLETARLAKSANLKTVMVSNGYINSRPLDDLLECIDAFNIDLKGFTEEFYHAFTGSSLEPVLNTLRQIRDSGRHLEITTLIIPTVNDDAVTFTDMINWIATMLGNKTILHLSRYYPAYMLELESTSPVNMNHLLTIARGRLMHVYAGNIHLSDFHDTCCSVCGSIIIKRSGYLTSCIGLQPDGSCSNCGHREIIR